MILSINNKICFHIIEERLVALARALGGNLRKMRTQRTQPTDKANTHSYAHVSTALTDIDGSHINRVFLSKTTDDRCLPTIERR